MATKRKAVTAYLDDAEAAMLAELAKASGRSESKWIVAAVREAHAGLGGSPTLPSHAALEREPAR